MNCPPLPLAWLLQALLVWPTPLAEAAAALRVHRDPHPDLYRENGSTVATAARLRVLVVGNSISHGYEADYTWRYRLWQWFQDNEVPADFVGPFQGTNPPDLAEPLPLSIDNNHLNRLNHISMPASPYPASFHLPPASFDGDNADEPRRRIGRYAADVDTDFAQHSRHFSLWGYQVAQAQAVIRDIVAAHAPDLVLVELGFNDLGWFASGPEGTLANMRALVEGARVGASASSRPSPSGIRFGLATVPQRTRLGGRDDLPLSTDAYNALLAAACPEWSTPHSPVHIVPLRETYACEVDDGCPAGHDGLHPNALGEFQIASAFSQVLHAHYGLGRAPLRVPASDAIPARPCPVPTNFRVVSVAEGVAATWDHAFGAYAYYVYTRATTEGRREDDDVDDSLTRRGAWNRPAWPTTKNRSDVLRKPSGWAWEVKVQADCGSGILSPFTDVRSAIAGAHSHEHKGHGQKPLFG